MNVGDILQGRYSYSNILEVVTLRHIEVKSVDQGHTTSTLSALLCRDEILRRKQKL